MKNSIFLKTLKGEETNRPPVWFMRQAGRVLPSYMALRKDYSFSEMMADPKLAAKVTLLPVHDLGVDAAILFSDILVIPEAMGMKLEFTDKGPVFENPLKDEANPLDCLLPDSSKLEYIYANIEEIIKTRPKNIPLIGFCGSPLTTFCYMVQGISRNHTFPEAVAMLYKNKEVAKKILERITDLSILYAKNQIKSGIEAFQLFETHAGLIPQNLYFEMIMPSVKRIAKAVKETGTPFIYMPKGLGFGLEKIEPSDADFISVDWQTPIEKARQLIHKDIGIQGNLDPRILLADKQSIEKELNNYLEFGKNNNNWIFNLGHGLIPQIPFENVKFVVDWVKNADWK